MFWVEFIFAVILTELLTELVIKSVLFRPIRERIKGLGSWFKEFFSCGYCFSVWAAYGVVLLLQLTYDFTGWFWLDLSLMGFIVHRLSNFLHNFNDKYLDKYYDLRFVNSESLGSEEVIKGEE
jgi:hypothetical protein